jgi:hypothetical protein
MNTRSWKWPAVGVASLLLLALGAHLAWEQHRYRLRTPWGTVRIGMTKEEVNATLGTPHFELLGRGIGFLESWDGDGWGATVNYGREDDRVTSALLIAPDGSEARIPRPSLFEHVRCWLRKRE